MIDANPPRRSLYPSLLGIPNLVEVKVGSLINSRREDHLAIFFFEKLRQRLKIHFSASSFSEADLSTPDLASDKSSIVAECGQRD